jgi:hypothetical protein
MPLAILGLLSVESNRADVSSFTVLNLSDDEAVDTHVKGSVLMVKI